MIVKDPVPDSTEGNGTRVAPVGGVAVVATAVVVAEIEAEEEVEIIVKMEGTDTVSRYIKGLFRTVMKCITVLMPCYLI